MHRTLEYLPRVVYIDNRVAGRLSSCAKPLLLPPDLENIILGEPPSCRLFLDACMKRILGSVDPQAASLTMDWSPLDVDVLWCVHWRSGASCSAFEGLRLTLQQFWRRYF